MSTKPTATDIVRKQLQDKKKSNPTEYARVGKSKPKPIVTKKK